MDPFVTPALEPLMRVEVDVGAVESLGTMAQGERRVVAINGGRVFCARPGGALAGRVLPGGADWQWVRSDGITEIAAHYVIQADGGDRLEIDSRGYRHGPAQVMQRLARGEPVARCEYYFRTAIRFRTASALPDLARLNGLIALAVGERRAAQVLLQVFELR